MAYNAPPNMPPPNTYSSGMPGEQAGSTNYHGGGNAGQQNFAAEPHVTTEGSHASSSKGAMSGAKGFLDKAWQGVMKVGAPVNKLTNKIGSEAFWPSTIDNECLKAARILKSFCKDGFYADHDENAELKHSGPKQKQRVLVKIPQQVIANAVGLAIFSTLRSGYLVSGSGGSGVVIGRLPDGSWSAPSGILVHTLGVGFNIGIDIYDCVMVINTQEALLAFTKLRVTLGGELSAVAGPVGAGGILDVDARPDSDKGHKDVTTAPQYRDRKPIFTYMKSRGLYVGLQVDGTFIGTRNDENAKFYGQKMPAQEIIAGGIRDVPREVRILQEVCRSAEGKPFNEELASHIGNEPAPSDMGVDSIPEPTEAQKNEFGSQAKDHPPSYSQSVGETSQAGAAPSHVAPIYPNNEKSGRDPNVV